VELAFGTSGLRGLVKDITDLEAYVDTRAFLGWLEKAGRIRRGGAVCLAGDLRPSTGAILQAVHLAVRDAGFETLHLGRIPTPACMAYAMARGAASVMVTGSHIPFDRNGIKYGTPRGEVLKGEEPAILEAVRETRGRLYGMPVEGCPFEADGSIRAERRLSLPPVIGEAGAEYVRRYGAFPAGALAGKRILLWQHSAVGRDILAEILAASGAEVIKAGRSDEFLPVDTEAIGEETLETVQALVDADGGAPLDAVVSTDGDSDRPLLLGVEGGRVRFFPGDLLGIVAADFLGVRRICLPVSATDAVDLHFRPRGIIAVRTRIGSPYVIAAMEEAGWEANGGFLTAVPLRVPGGGTIPALPTRDAALPILCALYASLGRGEGLSAVFDRLPPRHGKSAILREFPRDRALSMMRMLSPGDPAVEEARFAAEVPEIRRSGRTAPAEPALCAELDAVRRLIEGHFTPADGFGRVAWINWVDGVRIGFQGGDIAHLRPSGNAPELRLYAFADGRERAEGIAARATAADGALRRLEREAGAREAVSAFRRAPRPLVLRGVVRHYDWGGSRFIPELIGEANPQGRPFAELWIGAHPAAPSPTEVGGAETDLGRLVGGAAAEVLGPATAQAFGGTLPYLFKVLDARSMLSLQAHPSLEQAREGFRRENAAGIPLDAPRRTYKDDNHKPEVHVALRELWMLHGFRPLEDIAEAMTAVPELAAVMPDFRGRASGAGGDPRARARLVRDLFSRLMRMPQDGVDAALEPLLARLEAEEGRLRKGDPGFWALRAARSFPRPGGHRDRGIFSVYLLNLLRLEPGQGTFQPAGTLHAYLEGVNVELMANSDNVLRGGLTPKHVDTEQLLAALTFASGVPEILEGVPGAGAVTSYPTPTREFRLDRIELGAGGRHGEGAAHGPDSLLVLDGAAVLSWAGSAETIVMGRGGIVLVPAGIPYELRAEGGPAMLYRAGVPPGDAPA